MKLDLKFLESFKPKKTFKKENLQVSASKYWSFILIFFFVMLLGSLIFGYITFENLNKDFKDNREGEIKNSSLSQKNQILKVLEYFEIKETNTRDIIEKGVTVVDPSL